MGRRGIRGVTVELYGKEELDKKPLRRRTREKNGRKEKEEETKQDDYCLVNKA